VGGKIMAKMTNEELIAVFKEMTLLELSEFVKLFEDEFDVTAAAPAAVAVAAAPGAEAAAEEEKTEFDVVLESFGSEKIQVIKAVRALTGLGLKEAKEKVDGVPSVLLEGAKKEDADKAKADIEAVGGTVTLK
jgi:large subunit ribosomal protein L7/L12